MDETIVLIHGMWARGFLLDDLKEYFQNKGFNCISPDLPGHGGGKIEKYGFLDFVDHMAGEIKKLDKKPIVMGHSMGGLITHKIAEMGLAKKAVLITPATQRGVVNINPSSLMGFLPVALKPFFWKKPLNPSKKGFYYICNGVNKEKKKEIYSHLVPESGKAFTQIGLWALDFSRSTKIDNSKIECPVLQIACGKDSIIPERVQANQAKLMKSKVDDYQYKVYKNNGHGIIWEDNWDEMAGDIYHWITK